MSSFKSLNLFGSGPHRFALEAQGQLVVPKLRLGYQVSGSAWLGLEELTVRVTGRLIAPSESALWSLRDAITAQLLHPPTPGILIDNSGRSYTQMSFIDFEEADRVDRNRVCSMGYSARFRRFNDSP
ncbi:MAG: hypothetical protein JSS51_13050 [Planctomycetes bacterium]|nr:hypothetical protein [Planctomycetota bacterium]